jgi:hypothetical protein
MSFGYGESICPDCYDGEQPFIFLDDSFWLNRVLARCARPKMTKRKDDSIGQMLLDQAFVKPEMEITG